MTVKTFFEKFELFADVPGVVTKMRELVLEFAVTGRLSEYQSSDASISEFIEALSNGKARFSKNGRRGNIPIIQKEYLNIRPYNIPTHWAWVPLNKIGTISGGMTPSKDKSRFWNGDVNWFSSKDIKTNELTDAELKITREAVRATGLQVYPPGCLVMVARSGILKRTFPVSILKVEGTVNQDLKVLSPFVDGIERYLQIMLRGMTRYILTSLVKTGMTVQSLKYEEFETQVFPIPPLAEQKRIVAKVDELMALCDRLEAEQKEREEKKAALIRASLARFAKAPTPANLNYLFHKSYDIAPADLRKTILTLAIQGKLVPQNALEPSAKEILCKIEEMRGLKGEKSKTRKLESFSPVIHEDEPFKIPNEWRWCRLGTLGLIGSSYRVHEKDWTTNGVPFFRAREIVKLSKSGQVDNDLFITEEHYQLLASTGLIPEQNDIMITGVGTIGVPYVVRETDRFYFKDASVLIFKNCFGLYPFYLHMMMLSPYWNREIHRGSMGTTVHTLTIVRIKQTPIPLPPLAEQRRIVAKVGQLMALVDELEEQLAASCASGEKLLVALVAELTTLRKAPSTP